MEKRLISVILPTFNERGNIKKLILALIDNLKNKKIEIIVIDDNSPDGTAEMVKKLIKKYPLKLIMRRKKPGLALSIREGIKQASGEIIVVMDTDFNHKPTDVPKLLKKMAKEKADLVIGSRYIKGGGMVLAEVSKIQFIFSKIFNVFVRFLLGIPIHENLSGFVAVKKSVLTSLDQRKIFKGYGDYCMRLIYCLHHQGYKICEVPVVYGKRQWGRSKTKLFKHSLAYFLTVLELSLKGI